MWSFFEIYLLAVGWTTCLATYLYTRQINPPLLAALWLVADATFFLGMRWRGWDESLRVFTAQSWFDYTETGWLATAYVVTAAISMCVGISMGAGAHTSAKRPSDSLVRHGMVVARAAKLDRLGSNLRLVIAALALALTALQLLHVSLIDLSLLVYNNQYLLLREPSVHGLDSFFERFVFYLLRPSGLLAVVMAPFVYWHVQKLLGIWYVALSIYPFLYDFAQNSRFAALMFFACAITIVHVKPGKARFAGPLLFLFGAVVWIKVLILRNSPYQGLTGVYWFARELAQREYGAIDIARGLLLNMFQTTQTLAGALRLGGAYSVEYVIGSFSPLPSFIDGMGKMLRDEALRINAHVPYNAFAEAALFGIWGLVMFCGILTLWAAWGAAIWRRGAAVRRGLVLLSVLGFVHVLQYPLRNSLRYFWVAMIIDFMLVISASLTPRHAGPSRAQTGRVR